MNREIKFRAWDKEFSRMLGWGKYIKGITIGEIKTVESYNSEDGWSDTIALKDVELMQYTGLKDKNGKEIYEGDIVKYKFAFYRDISKVEFNQDIAAFDMVSIKELDDNSSMRAFEKGSRRGFNKNLVAGFDYVEIIGNIYENPELLEIV